MMSKPATEDTPAYEPAPYMTALKRTAAKILTQR